MEFQIADLLESIADRIPDREAVICGDRRLTYREFDERATRLANAFRQMGIGAGDHIGLYLYNGTEYLEAMYAAMKIRAVAININYRYVEAELSYMIDDADLVALLHQRELAPIVEDAAQDAQGLRHFIVVEDGSGADISALGAVDYDGLLESGSPHRDFAKRSGDDLYLIYTGGTTGMPKGVMWRHEDLFFAGLQGGDPNGDDIETPEELAPIAEKGDLGMRILPAPPFIHGTSQFASWISLFAGGTVIIHGAKRYDARKCAELIDQEKVTVFVFVGDAMAMPFVDVLNEEPGRYDMESMVAVTSQGAILSRTVQTALAEHFPYALILNNYGASETGHAGRALPLMGDEKKKDSRIKFFMDENTMVVDDDLNVLEPGSAEVGKLARRGRLPLGYYKDEEKSARTFFEVEGKRWCVPGDFASIDEDGFITLLGRGSICINTGGEKVFPEEVEEALKGHPSVFDAVVVGLEDEKWGQRVTAIVQPREGTEVDLEALDAHCRTKIAGYKVPRTIHLVAAVDRHPSGKPDYRWAKQAAQDLERDA
jgi:3-oxocholest-4-en-26-oate---CoA ligase